MYQLLETIKCYNGKLYNLKEHNLRFNQARNICFGIKQTIDLADFINIPVNAKTGLFRCRVSYTAQIEKIEFIAHQYRTIKNLKLVEDDNVEYMYKYSNRSHLQKLFEKRGNCDDILIVKNGYITDSFTANPIFFDGENWWTPRTPLLKGTQRERLLKKNKIHECPITPNDLNKYKKVGLINALQDLNNMPIISINYIQF